MFRSTSPAAATTSGPQEEARAEDTKVVDNKKEETTRNDNVQEVSSGEFCYVESICFCLSLN